MSEKITIEIELSDEFLADVMCVIVESDAIGYWATISDVRCLRVANVTWDEYLAFHIQDDFDMRGFWFDRESVARGIKVALSPGFKLNRSLRGQIHAGATGDDAGEIDIAAADVIVRAAIFGELLYG